MRDELGAFLTARLDGEAWSVLNSPPHVSVQDRQVILDRVKALYAVAALHGPDHSLHEPHCSSCGDVPQVEYPCDTLRALVSTYRRHPDYRAEWDDDDSLDLMALCPHAHPKLGWSCTEAWSHVGDHRSVPRPNEDRPEAVWSREEGE